jgi:hypothetical protein
MLTYSGIYCRVVHMFRFSATYNFHLQFKKSAEQEIRVQLAPIDNLLQRVFFQALIELGMTLSCHHANIGPRV